MSDCAPSREWSGLVRMGDRVAAAHAKLDAPSCRPARRTTSPGVRTYCTAALPLHAAMARGAVLPNHDERPARVSLRADERHIVDDEEGPRRPHEAARAAAAGPGYVVLNPDDPRVLEVLVPPSAICSTTTSSKPTRRSRRRSAATARGARRARRANVLIKLIRHTVAGLAPLSLPLASNSPHVERSRTKPSASCTTFRANTPRNHRCSRASRCARTDRSACGSGTRGPPGAVAVRAAICVDPRLEARRAIVQILVVRADDVEADARGCSHLTHAAALLPQGRSWRSCC